jgi:hypothetical protein
MRRSSVAWAIRDFSNLFIYSKKLEEYSTLSRLSYASILLMASILTRLYLDGVASILGFSYITILALITISMFKGFKNTVRGMTLLVLFTGIALFTYLVSGLLGWSRQDPVSILSGTMYVYALFTSLSCFLQLVPIREWGGLMNRLGFKNTSMMMSLTLLQTPLIIIYTSEAYTTIKLKYGSKRLYKVVTPLILLTFYTTRGLAEAYILYGFHVGDALTMWSSRDLLLYLTSVVVLTGILLLILIG